MSPTVSVCMATYNGSSYVEHQIRSILDQLGVDDELIVVDDASTDDTVARVETIADDRIRLHPSEHNRGYVKTFERALTLARGDLLLLSDQDDEWLPGRVAAMSAALADHRAVASNLVLMGSDDPLPHPLSRRPWRLRSGTGAHALRNELGILAGVMPYYGCAMGVRRDLLDSVLPFPAFLTESHDLWIALVANAQRQMHHLARPTIRRRLHDANASPSRPREIRRVIAARIMLLRALLEATRRRRRVA